MFYGKNAAMPILWFLLWSLPVLSGNAVDASLANPTAPLSHPFWEQYPGETLVLGMVFAAIAGAMMQRSFRRQGFLPDTVVLQVLPMQAVIVDQSGRILFGHDGENPESRIAELRDIRQISGATPEILRAIKEVFALRRAVTIEGDDGLGIRTAILTPLPRRGLFSRPAVLWLSHRNPRMQCHRDLLVERLRHYVSHERIVNHCLAQIVKEHDFEANLEAIFKAIVRQIDCDYIGFGDCGPEDRFESIREWVRPFASGPASEISLARKEFPAAWREAFRRHEFIAIADMENSEYRELFRDTPLKSLLLGPVFTDNRLTGLLGVGFIHARQEFSDLNEDSIRSAAHIIVLAREQARQRRSLNHANREKMVIFNHIDIPIWLYDANARLLQVNPTVERLCGLGSADILNCNCNDIFCKDGADRPLCPVIKAIAADRRVSREATLFGRELIITADPVHDASGKIIYVIKSAVDITEINAGKRQLEKAMQEAQAANRAKNYFLTTMSHELRTPLNAVIGFAELLKTGETTAEETEDYLQSIHFAGSALLNLINDILDLTKLEANQLEIIPERGDLARLCGEIQTLFLLQTTEKQLQFILDLPPQLPELYFDRHRMRQILLNLAGNAVKYTRFGSVSIRVEFAADGDGRGELTIAVSDTGPGIPDSLRSRIFDPFVQHDDLTTPHGTGLGLAIARRLTERMGGSLVLESSSEYGSCFTLRLGRLRIAPDQQSLPSGNS